MRRTITQTTEIMMIKTKVHLLEMVITILMADDRVTDQATKDKAADDITGLEIVLARVRVEAIIGGEVAMGRIIGS